MKSATSTTAKRDVRKTYNSKIKEINNWYYQELKQAKVDCGLNATSTAPLIEKFNPVKEQIRLRIHSTSTATTTTSTQ